MTIYIISVTSIIFVIALLRNEIVFRARIKAINYISFKSNMAIENKDGDWRRFYIEFDNGDSFIKQIFSLTKWRYRDFYPHYKEV